VDAFKKKVLYAWCFRTGQSSHPLVIAAQKDPENGWHFHPHMSKDIAGGGAEKRGDALGASPLESR
jgi:hypothetical protein